MSTALMTITNVDDCKKRLVGLPLFPAVDGACPFTNIPRIIIITTTDIVVRLAWIGCDSRPFSTGPDNRRFYREEFHCDFSSVECH